MEQGPCIEKGKYYVFYFWTKQNNAPKVLRDVDGYPIEFDIKEAAVNWIKHKVDENCNITYCITQGNEYDIKALKEYDTRPVGLKSRWDGICESYLETFCYKHDYRYEPNMWVGNDVGTFAYIGDMVVSMDDIRYDVDHIIDPRTFEKWYFKGLDVLEITGENYMNYPSYCKGAPDYWTDERLNKICEMKANINQKQKELEEEIENFKRNMPDEVAKENIEDLNAFQNVSRIIEPEMVDLVLSVKWMKYNLGATGGSSAADWYGGYYAWGELVSGKTDYIYSWDNYQYGSYDYLSKYNEIDHLTTLKASDDAATVAYGPNFRMPTQAELDELTDLTNEWVTDYQGISGLNGCLFHGKGAYSANTLFIPAAGFCDREGRFVVGDDGYIWSSSLDESVSEYAWCLNFDSDGVGTYEDCRYYGCSVRGVAKK